MKKQTGAGERPRHWLLLTAYTGCPKHPLQVKFMNIVTEISYWCHCSYNLTLNKFPKTCIPVKWIFSEICEKWYWHELLMGQMLVASDQIHIEIHAEATPCQCCLCGKTLIQISVLNDLMLTHTREKPHQYNQCDQAFTLNCNVKTHM